MPLHLDLISWKRRKELEGKQFWRFSQSFLKLVSSRVLMSGALGSNFIIFGWVLMFFLPNRIFLINTLSIGFAATHRLRGTTHTESRDVLVNGFGLFWNLLLIKSSIANSTPPMWLYFPFPRRPRPAGHVHAARSTS